MSISQNNARHGKKIPNSGTNNNVTVCVRIRPENDAERKAAQPVAFMTSVRSIFDQYLWQLDHLLIGYYCACLIRMTVWRS